MKKYITNENSRLSAFGVLIDALDLTSTQISKEIFVDRSLVGKWKNGSRKLKKSSAYYDKLLDFLIRENNKKTYNIIKQILEPIYGKNILNSEKILKQYLDKFISEPSIPFEHLETLNKSKSNIYNASIFVSLGYEGRLDAFNTLINTAEIMKEPEDIFIIETDSYKWILNNSKSNSFSKRLLNLLDRNFHIYFINIVYFNKSYNLDFFYNYNEVLFHQNTLNYYYNSYKNNIKMNSQYLIKNRLSIIGMNNCDNMFYTAIYNDHLSIIQHQKNFENILFLSSHSNKLYSFKDNKPILDTIKQFQYTQDIIYFCNHTPDFISMDKNLLNEILNDNCVTETEKKQCFEYYNILHQQLTYCPNRHIYCFKSIKDYINIDNIPYDCLSKIIGKEIIVTKKQYIRHLEQIINLVKSSDNFCVSIIQEEKEVFSAKSNFWCKENSWIFYFNNNHSTKFNNTPIVLNITTVILRLWWDNLSSEYKKSEYVINLLQSLIKSNKI